MWLYENVEWPKEIDDDAVDHLKDPKMTTKFFRTGGKTAHDPRFLSVWMRKTDDQDKTLLQDSVDQVRLDVLNKLPSAFEDYTCPEGKGIADKPDKGKAQKILLDALASLPPNKSSEDTYYIMFWRLLECLLNTYPEHGEEFESLSDDLKEISDIDQVYKERIARVTRKESRVQAVSVARGEASDKIKRMEAIEAKEAAMKRDNMEKAKNTSIACGKTSHQKHTYLVCACVPLLIILIAGFVVSEGSKNLENPFGTLSSLSYQNDSDEGKAVSTEILREGIERPVNTYSEESNVTQGQESKWNFVNSIQKKLGW